MNQDALEQPAGGSLAGLGVSGGWQVDIDEIIDDGRWLLAIDGPAVYLVMEAGGPDEVTRAAAYLRHGPTSDDPSGQTNGLKLGRFDTNPVCVVWDHEAESDRCFLVVGAHASTLRITLDGTSARQLGEALANAHADALDRYQVEAA